MRKLYILLFTIFWISQLTAQCFITDKTYGPNGIRNFESNSQYPLPGMTLVDSSNGNLYHLGSFMGTSSSDPDNYVFCTDSIGVLNNVFGNQGYAYFDFVFQSEISFSDAIIHAHSIYICALQSSLDNSIQVVKLTGKGNRDSSFAKDGLLKMAFSNSNFHGGARSHIISVDSAALLIGTTIENASTGRVEIVLIKIRNNGSLDSSFGQNGVSRIKSPRDGLGFDYFEALQGFSYSDNGLLLLGNDGNLGEYCVGKIKKNGQVDSGYQKNGFSPPIDQPMQSFVHKATWNNRRSCFFLTLNSADGMAIVAINAKGYYDSGFGLNGYVRFESGTSLTMPGSISILPDRVVASGYITVSSSLKRLFTVCMPLNYKQFAWNIDANSIFDPPGFTNNAFYETYSTYTGNGNLLVSFDSAFNQSGTHAVHSILRLKTDPQSWAVTSIKNPTANAFPNPVHIGQRIEVHLNGLNGALHTQWIELTSNRVVEEYIKESSSTQLNLQLPKDIKPGSYMLRISDGTQHVILRVIIL